MHNCPQKKKLTICGLCASSDHQRSQCPPGAEEKCHLCKNPHRVGSRDCKDPDTVSHRDECEKYLKVMPTWAQGEKFPPFPNVGFTCIDRQRKARAKAKRPPKLQSQAASQHTGATSKAPSWKIPEFLGPAQLYERFPEDVEAARSKESTEEESTEDRPIVVDSDGDNNESPRTLPSKAPEVPPTIVPGSSNDALSYLVREPINPPSRTPKPKRTRPLASSPESSTGSPKDTQPKTKKRKNGSPTSLEDRIRLDISNGRGNVSITEVVNVDRVRGPSSRYTVRVKGKMSNDEGKEECINKEMSFKWTEFHWDSCWTLIRDYHEKRGTDPKLGVLNKIEWYTLQDMKTTFLQSTQGRATIAAGNEAEGSSQSTVKDAQPAKGPDPRPAAATESSDNEDNEDNEDDEDNETSEPSEDEWVSEDNEDDNDLYESP